MGKLYTPLVQTGHLSLWFTCTSESCPYH